MRTAIKTCRECWKVSLFVGLLFVANGLDMCWGAHNHNFSLPLILKVFSFL